MPVFGNRNDFAENTPRRLIKALLEAGSERELSRRLGVNILYISQLLRDGKEPTDQTEKGQAVRVKLFLPRRKRKPRAERPAEPEWLKSRRKAIRQMVKETKQVLKWQ